jgi:hypothetical protein
MGGPAKTRPNCRDESGDLVRPVFHWEGTGEELTAKIAKPKRPPTKYRRKREGYVKFDPVTLHARIRAQARPVGRAASQPSVLYQTIARSAADRLAA